MIISHSHRFAFISTMKCATNSLTQALIRDFDGVMPGGLHERRMELVPAGYFTFSVCRNPYTRAISLWWSTCMRNALDRYGFRQACADPDTLGGFMQWVNGLRTVPHELLLTQSQWHRDTRVDRFLKIEDLDAEFAALPFARPGASLGLLNATTTEQQGIMDLQRLQAGDGDLAFSTRPQRRRSAARDYLTPGAVEAVQAWAAEDFDRFGYSRDPQVVVDIALE